MSYQFTLIISLHLHRPISLNNSKRYLRTSTSEQSVALCASPAYSTHTKESGEQLQAIEVESLGLID